MRLNNKDRDDKVMAQLECEEVLTCIYLHLQVQFVKHATKRVMASATARQRRLIIGQTSGETRLCAMLNRHHLDLGRLGHVMLIILIFILFTSTPIKELISIE